MPTHRRWLQRVLRQQPRLARLVHRQLDPPRRVLAVRAKRDRKEGAFELGRFEFPVSIIALIWVVAVLCVLVATSDLVVTLSIVGGVLVVGACYIAYWCNSNGTSLRPNQETRSCSNAGHHRGLRPVA